MKKVTAIASNDVALIKYWGKKDEILRLPENGSISLVLDGLDTTTTVEFDTNLSEDAVTIESESDPVEVKRVIQHLDRLRKIAGVETKARVVSINNFPKGTGLSSSGSGFAALTVAGVYSLELNLSEKELSILARQGSGTACRCVCAGVVEWKDGSTSDTSYSETIFPADHIDIRDIIAVVDEGHKKISSTEGHQHAQTSIFYRTRLENLPKKIDAIKHAFVEKDFKLIGEIAEAEALEFHSILMTGNPALLTWYPGTIEVMQAVKSMRAEGVVAYFTINTGFNVHILTVPEFEKQVSERIEKLSLVQRVLQAKIGNGPRLSEDHLF